MKDLSLSESLLGHGTSFGSKSKTTNLYIGSNFGELFNRNSNDKKLKNASSERVIPIHPKLIDLGVLNFVKEQNNNNSQRLFTHLKLGSEGYIKNVSRFSNVKWLHAIGVKTSKKSFHSLRHTFANVLKQAGVSEQVASVLLGHASQSISYGRYGKESRVETFLNEIKKNKNIVIIIFYFFSSIFLLFFQYFFALCH